MSPDSNENKLAILGAEPSFKEIIPVGQLNFPDWDRVQQSFRGIFEREYYTNQGPLTEQLEDQLQQYLGVKHVICMSNGTIALMIAAKALELSGKVICPAYTFIATAQSLTWSGLSPVFCDVDAQTHQMSVTHASQLIDDDVSAILGVHLWGHACSPNEFEALAAEKDLKLYFDAAQAFGCEYKGKKISQFGDLEVFSFHATKVFSSIEGGCVSTNNDYLASRLRNIRSSYGAREAIEVPLTGNGRMSEAQAAMALLSLEDYPEIQKRNKHYFDLYAEGLANVPGIRIIAPQNFDHNNFQYVVIEVSDEEFGLNRNELLNVLKAENVSSRKYFSPGVHRSPPYNELNSEFVDALPVTDKLCNKVMQLPSGSDVSPDKIVEICRIIKTAHKLSSMIRSG